MKRMCIIIALTMASTLAKMPPSHSYEFENVTHKPIIVSIQGVPQGSMIIEPGTKGKMMLESGQQITIAQPYTTQKGSFSRMATVQQPGSYRIGIDQTNNLQAIAQQKGSFVGRQPTSYI